VVAVVRGGKTKDLKGFESFGPCKHENLQSYKSCVLEFLGCFIAHIVIMSEFLSRAVNLLSVPMKNTL